MHTEEPGAPNVNGNKYKQTGLTRYWKIKINIQDLNCFIVIKFITEQINIQNVNIQNNKCKKTNTLNMSFDEMDTT